MNGVAAKILAAYEDLMSLDPSQVEEIGVSIPIPYFDAEVLTELCYTTMGFLKKSPILETIKPPVYVIGDLHGNIFDLLRILNATGKPPNVQLLFLGDYVDRGDFSIEVVTLLFALYCMFPMNVTLLRGNHEFQCLNATYGFQDEVTSRYPGTELYETFNSVFWYLPLAATIGGTIFCVHGGLSPNLKTIEQVSSIAKPVLAYNDELISDLVWSDPCEDTATYKQGIRGSGVQFGHDAAAEFLDKHQMKHIFRAHQCVQMGLAKSFKNLLYTVFSCSCYAEATDNRCGLIFVTSDPDKFQMFSLPPFHQMPRSATNFVDKSNSEGQEELDWTHSGDCCPCFESLESEKLAVLKYSRAARLTNRKRNRQYFTVDSSQKLPMLSQK